MKREIKFRAWNGGKMLFDDKIAFVPPLFSTQAQTLREGLDALKKGYALMQYTGLKDKNGKEIYEGDIVTNMGVTNDMKKRAFEIVWNEENARYSAYEIESDMHTSLNSYEAAQLVIIGNMYEK